MLRPQPACSKFNCLVLHVAPVRISVLQREVSPQDPLSRPSGPVVSGPSVVSRLVLLSSLRGGPMARENIILSNSGGWATGIPALAMASSKSRALSNGGSSSAPFGAFWSPRLMGQPRLTSGFPVCSPAMARSADGGSTHPSSPSAPHFSRNSQMSILQALYRASGRRRSIHSAAEKADGSRIG